MENKWLTSLLREGYHVNKGTLHRKYFRELYGSAYSCFDRHCSINDGHCTFWDCVKSDLCQEVAAVCSWWRIRTSVPVKYPLLWREPFLLESKKPCLTLQIQERDKLVSSWILEICCFSLFHPFLPSGRDRQEEMEMFWMSQVIRRAGIFPDRVCYLRTRVHWSGLNVQLRRGPMVCSRDLTSVYCLTGWVSEVMTAKSK